MSCSNRTFSAASIESKKKIIKKQNKNKQTKKSLRWLGGRGGEGDLQPDQGSGEAAGTGGGPGEETHFPATGCGPTESQRWHVDSEGSTASPVRGVGIPLNDHHN